MAQSSQVPAWRSYCPVARTLDLIGDRWTLLVVRDLLLGMGRYEQFLDRPERISTNMLADRLRRLEELGYVSRHRYGGHSERFEYRLTPRGENLRPLVQSIVDWGIQHIPGTEVKLWQHVNTGTAIRTAQITPAADGASARGVSSRSRRPRDASDTSNRGKRSSR